MYHNFRFLCVKIISLFIACVCVIITVETAWALTGNSSNKTALVIGNRTYSVAPLQNPVNDAREMSKILQELGFEVILKTDLNYREMREAVHLFGEKMANKHGAALFFFAGHGMQINGVNYLIPIDADIRSEREVKYNSIDANYILDEMEAAKNMINIIILDACRGNPFYRSFRSSKEGLAAMRTGMGTIIAYSTSPGVKAEDGIGSNSIYTSALVQEMKIPGKRLSDMFNSVRRTVRIQTDGMQIPWETTSLESPFYFIPPENKEMVPDFPVKINDKPADKPLLLSEKKQHRPGEEWIEPLTGIIMVWVPGGCYEMGCGSHAYQQECEADEFPAHEVCLDGFWLSKYEITHKQYLIFINESQDRGPAEQNWFKTHNEDNAGRIILKNGIYTTSPDDENRPMVNVSWFGAVNFAEWLTHKTGAQFRLPTEAEWEYAARDAGKNTIYAGSDHAESVANLDGVLQPVGMKQPNELGIHDLSGNAWEWCIDVYRENAYKIHTRMNPMVISAMKNSADGALRVIRGGSHGYSSIHARNTNRGSNWIGGVAGDLGFRIVMHSQPIIISRQLSY